MRLYDTLQANGDGATIDPLTYKPRQFGKGYAVSLTDNAFLNLTPQATAENARKLKEYARNMNIKNYFLGYWRDTKTGKNYLDISIILPRKSEALTLAKIFGQKAIFDFRTLSSIYL